MNESNIDKRPVMIIGAGPVGMLLALLLARRKINSLLIEKRTDELEWSKAIGITPPSLEILAEAGLDDIFAEHGLAITEALVHDDHGVAGTVRFDQLAGRHKFILTLPQSDTLKILARAIAATPQIEYRRGFELVAVSQQSDSIVSILKNRISGGLESLRSDWLIGCDGSKSDLREILGIDHRHTAYPNHFAMADFPESTAWGCQAHLFFTRYGSLESFPLPQNKRRWVALLPGVEDQHDSAAALMQRIRLIAGQDPPNHEKSPVFEFQPERIDLAATCHGRAILAGDAAHVMSPIGGQGMNTGLADAGLLARIMPRLLVGEDADTLLADYDFIRRRAARTAARRAAVGMWVGTRTGRLPSALRGTLLRNVLLRHPISSKLPPHFAMLTIPGNRAGGAT